MTTYRGKFSVRIHRRISFCAWHVPMCIACSMEKHSLLCEGTSFSIIFRRECVSSETSNSCAGVSAAGGLSLLCQFSGASAHKMAFMSSFKPRSVVPFWLGLVYPISLECTRKTVSDSFHSFDCWNLLQAELKRVKTPAC